MLEGTTSSCEPCQAAPSTCMTMKNFANVWLTCSRNRFIMAVEAVFQDERDQVTSHGRNGREDVDRLTNQLGQHMRPDPRRRPTAPRPSDTAKAAFILRQDQHGALIAHFPRRDCCLHLRRKVFLNCSCTCGSAWGWRGRGISLRQPCRASRR